MSDVSANADAAVAALDDDVFARCGREITRTLAAGEGMTLFLQPGDMTRYRITIGSRRSVTFSSGEDPSVEVLPLHATSIGFGTDSQFDTTVVGHMAALEPAHPWTAAVWRRLCNEVES